MGLETCRLLRAGQKSSLRGVRDGNVTQLQLPPHSFPVVNLCTLAVVPALTADKGRNPPLVTLGSAHLGSPSLPPKLPP